MSRNDSLLSFYKRLSTGCCIISKLIRLIHQTIVRWDVADVHMLISFPSIFDIIVYDEGSMSYLIKVLLIFFCVKTFSNSFILLCV